MDQLMTLQCLLTFMMLVQNALSLCPKCNTEDLHSIKLVCQQEGQLLDEAELTNNKTIVCNSLDDLLTCVAEKVPQCLSTFGSETQRYRWTPWDCHLSPNQVYKYQDIIHNGCKPYATQHVRTLPDRSSDIDMDELQSSNLSINDTNSSSKTDCGYIMPIGIVWLQLIKFWPLYRLP